LEKKIQVNETIKKKMSLEINELKKSFLSKEIQNESKTMNDKSIQSEVALLMKGTDVDINEFQQLVLDGLDSWDLLCLPTDCLGVLASQLYSFGLINQVVKNQPSIDGCVNEFKTSIKYLKEVPKVENHCRKFLQAFLLVGGSYSSAANALSKEWTDAANERFKYDIKLLQNPSEDVTLLEIDEEIRLKCVLKEVLEFYCTKLNSLSNSDESLEDLANELFSLELISRGVKKKPSINGFLSEFGDCIDMSTGVLEIQSECNKFLKAVTALGGKYKKLANIIKNKLVEKVNNEFNIMFTLHNLISAT
jgi:hypothetical protein